MTAVEHMEAVIIRSLRLAKDHWKDKILRRRYLSQARRAYNAMRGLQ